MAGFLPWCTDFVTRARYDWVDGFNSLIRARIKCLPSHQVTKLSTCWFALGFAVSVFAQGHARWTRWKLNGSFSHCHVLWIASAMLSWIICHCQQIFSRKFLCLRLQNLQTLRCRFLCHCRKTLTFRTFRIATQSPCRNTGAPRSWSSCCSSLSLWFLALRQWI